LGIIFALVAVACLGVVDACLGVVVACLGVVVACLDFAYLVIHILVGPLDFDLGILLA